MNIFKTLTQIPNLDGPKFVFAHIMSPHPPFVFSEDGGLAKNGECDGWDGNLFSGSQEEYRAGYEQQIKYISLLLQKSIPQIISNSEVPPIILVQGDHGPGLFTDFDSSENSCLKERSSILNAYYFPTKDYDALYPSITPVNSFRVILNQYFDQELILLDDKIFFELNEEVTDRIEQFCTP